MMSTATPSRPASRDELRLTRRGRLVLVLSVLCLVLLATVAVGSSVLATSTSGEPLEAARVTVQPGQTLWDIAASSGAGGDLRDTVYRIQQLNHLDGAELQIGQTLEVPSSD